MDYRVGWSVSSSKTGTIVPNESYHKRKRTSAARGYKNNGSLDKGPINHQLINRARELFFLRRGMPIRGQFFVWPET
jgi:hypothetical protein